MVADADICLAHTICSIAVRRAHPGLHGNDDYIFVIFLLGIHGKIGQWIDSVLDKARDILDVLLRIIEPDGLMGLVGYAEDELSADGIRERAHRLKPAFRLPGFYCAFEVTICDLSYHLLAHGALVSLCGNSTPCEQGGIGLTRRRD